MTRMHNPPHPGEVLKDGVIDAGISVTDFARTLGVNRVTLSRLLNGQHGVSAEMAVRLAKALGGSAESWLHMQASYDLWQAEHSATLRRQVSRIRPIAQQAEAAAE
ncbi:MAG: HigA family addiction module antitoxin [Burkholderiaceae bacterium]|jgi:addiction module HigA family antidote|nr:HigA family addiction module antitoxin [Burkholderiaceae bacterium]